MKQNQSVFTASLLVLLAILVTACAPAQPAALSNAGVIILTGDLLAAINENDYAAFHADFSDEMLAAFPESEFGKLRDLLQASSGNYQSCGEPSLTNNQGYAIYNLRCTFEKEDVVVRIVFQINGTQVDGLFFDSPNLRNLSK